MLSVRWIRCARFISRGVGGHGLQAAFGGGWGCPVGFLRSVGGPGPGPDRSVRFFSSENDPVLGLGGQSRFLSCCVFEFELLCVWSVVYLKLFGLFVFAPRRGAMRFGNLCVERLLIETNWTFSEEHQGGT